MQVVGRQYHLGGGKYRYGFNGKENDNEVKGEGNQQDYGMRIYDPRVGRFLSVDPITSKYPELTPYQFASNRPIDGIDQDGLEYIKALPNFPNSGDRTFVDYVNAANNGIIDIVNVIPATWNGSVDVFQSLGKGSLVRDLKQEINGISDGLRNIAAAIEKDPGRVLTSPDALRVASSFYFAGKFTLPGGGNKGNLLKPSSIMTEEANGGSRSLNPLKGTNNCAGCTVAADATLKGNPATALNHGVTGLKDFLSWFGTNRMEVYGSPQSIMKVMDKMEDGATGVIFGNRGAGEVGHYFNVVKKGGTVTFLDFQKEIGSRVLNPATLMKEQKFENLYFLNTTSK